MAQKQPKDALAAYERSLGLYPGRFNSLLGAAMAARSLATNLSRRTFYRELPGSGVHPKFVTAVLSGDALEETAHRNVRRRRDGSHHCDIFDATGDVIAFTSDMEGDCEIYTIKGDGTSFEKGTPSSRPLKTECIGSRERLGRSTTWSKPLRARRSALESLLSHSVKL